MTKPVPTPLVPAGQVVQVAAPDEAEKVPAKQEVQTEESVCPVVAEKVPTLQLTHAVAPVAG